jgi:DNA-binding NarL/FixJ family response regulator
MNEELINILIIDDDDNFRNILTKRIKFFMPNSNFTEFSRIAVAEEFLNKETKEKWDLVILDEQLPDGRGYDLLVKGYFTDLAVITISSDKDPKTPGRVMSAGASFFLDKLSIKEDLFEPLIKGIIDRNRIQKELTKSKLEQHKIDTVKTLVGTLRHEINNPLGAVLGGAYLIKQSESSTPDQVEAARLVEDSGKRIKYVLDQLCKAIELDSIAKANQKVFHIPGDAPWEEKKK